MAIAGRNRIGSGGMLDGEQADQRGNGRAKTHDHLPTGRRAAAGEPQAQRTMDRDRCAVQST
jgi:hypothetical protein